MNYIMTDTLKDYDFIKDENNQYWIITSAREKTVYFLREEISELSWEEKISQERFQNFKKINPNTNETFLSMYNCFVSKYAVNDMVRRHLEDDNNEKRKKLKEILEKCSKENPTTIDDLLKVFLDKGQ